MKSHLPHLLVTSIIYTVSLFSCSPGLSRRDSEIAVDDESALSSYSNTTISPTASAQNANTTPNSELSSNDANKPQDQALPIPLDSASGSPQPELAPPKENVFEPEQPKTADATRKWIALPASETELFMSQGPTIEEVLQPALENCTVYATLGSLVMTAPDRIQKMVKLIGKTNDGSNVYTVTLFDNINQKFKDIVIDDKFFGNLTPKKEFLYDLFYEDPVSKKLVIWPSIIQKAFALFYGSYNAMPTNEMIAMYVLTGQLATPVVFPPITMGGPGEAVAELSHYIGKGYVTTVDSALYESGKPNDGSSIPVSSNSKYNCALVSDVEYCLVSSHQYQVVSFDGLSVTLRNPWGYNTISPDAAKGQVALPIAAYLALTAYTWRSFLPVSEWTF